jgi:hypothetical protein
VGVGVGVGVRVGEDSVGGVGEGDGLLFTLTHPHPHPHPEDRVATSSELLGKFRILELFSTFRILPNLNVFPKSVIPLDSGFNEANYNC